MGSFVVRCAIWYHLYNLKKVKNTHGGVLILVVKLVVSEFATELLKKMQLWEKLVPWSKYLSIGGV